MMKTNKIVGPIGQVYLVLGRCFSYPQEGFCEVMKDNGMEMEDEMKALVGRLPFEMNFKGIPSPSLPQDELESEYINSFDIAPACPLYESYYRSDELSRADILEELLRFYEHFGIKLSDQEKDYPDHLVAEMEFMAFLAQKEASALEQGKDPVPYRRAQLDFLDRHLGQWVDKLDQRIQKVVKERFYKRASSFLKEFIKGHLLHVRKQVIEVAR